MKLSQRETVLIFILAVIVIIFVGLNFVIKPAIANNQKKQLEYEELDQTLIKYKADISLLDTIDEQIEKQYSVSLEAAEPFLKSIEQTDIDRYINKLVNKNKITQISIDISEMQISNADYFAEKVTEKTDDTNIPIQQSAEIINGTASNNASAETSDNNSTNLMYCTTVNLTVSGTHDRIINFMDDLYADGRAFTIDKLSNTTTTNSADEKVSMTMRFFGAPEIKID